MVAINTLTKKSTATTNKHGVFDSSVFIKINATWINHRLSFVARYLGVRTIKPFKKVLVKSVKNIKSIMLFFLRLLPVFIGFEFWAGGN